MADLPGFATVTLPVVAPAGTTAVIVVAETTVNEVASTPLNRTEVAPKKLRPVMVTVAPTLAVPGENELTVGVG